MLAFGLDYISIRSHGTVSAGHAGFMRRQSVSGRWIHRLRADFVLRELGDELTAGGYSDDDVRGILGENYLRVLDANTRSLDIKPRVSSDYAGFTCPTPQSPRKIYRHTSMTRARVGALS